MKKSEKWKNHENPKNSRKNHDNIRKKSKKSRKNHEKIRKIQTIFRAGIEENVSSLQDAKSRLVIDLASYLQMDVVAKFMIDFVRK